MQNKEDYIQWQKQYQNAKARLRTGNTLSAMGSIIAVVGSILYVADKEEVINYDIWGSYTEEKFKTNYLIGALAGSAIGLAGFLMAEPAKSDVRMLELEGAKKGYILANFKLIKGGCAVQLTYTF